MMNRAHIAAAAGALLVAFATNPGAAPAAVAPAPTTHTIRFAWIFRPAHLDAGHLDDSRSPNRAIHARAGRTGRRGDIAFLILGGDLTEKTGDPAEQDAFQKCMVRNTIPAHLRARQPRHRQRQSARQTRPVARARIRRRRAAPRVLMASPAGAAAFFIINTFACDSKDTDVLRRADDQLLRDGPFLRRQPRRCPQVRLRPRAPVHQVRR